MDAIDDQETDEDQAFEIALSASDVDGDDLSFSASVDGNALASVDGTTLTVIPDLNYSGDIAVTVVVSDGEYSDSDTFTLTVNPVNDAPTVDAIANETIFEDEIFEMAVSGNDVDLDDVISFSASVDGNASALSLIHI